MRSTLTSVLLLVLAVDAGPAAAQRLEQFDLASLGGARDEAPEARRAVAQVGTISGTVTDAATARPIAGASVSITGTARGATTASDGRFVIQNVPAGSRTIQVSAVGYGPAERPVSVTAGQGVTVNVQLNASAVMLEEVVAVGYGTQRKAHLTAAVDQVGAEALQSRPISNVTQGLQGVLPNVNIRPLSGRPTESPRINVRGTTSIGQGGNALVLIDGVEGDPGMLNPNDIEAVSVLKDAAAAAVYGARGAFGVILITTKRPTRGGFAITYETNYGVRQQTVPSNYVSDGYTFARMFNESFVNWEGTNPQNVNKTLVFSQDYLKELERRSQDRTLPEVEIGPDGRYVYYGSTDWYDLLYDSAPPSNEHSLSVSRSTDRASFMISGRYLFQDGLFRYSSDDFRMLNLRATGTLQLYDWLEMSNNFSVADRNYYNPLNVGEGGGIWRNLADEGHVLSPLLNPDGTLTHSAAYTVGDFYHGKNGTDYDRSVIRNTTGLTARFLDEALTVNGDFSFQNSRNDERRRRVQIPYSIRPNEIRYLGTQFNDIRNVNNDDLYLATNLYGDYRKLVGDRHYFNMVVGGNYEESTGERLDVQRNGLAFPDAENINLALGQSIVTSGNYEKWAILGGFYRLGYNFDERYLVELNGRYDGSSKFPSDQRYAFFPSASAGWRISGEPFWKVPERLVSDLKVRASYGSMGNGNIAPYTFNEQFTIRQSNRILNGVQPQLTSTPAVLPEGLTWETVTTSNLGADLEMFSGKLALTGDAYIRNTTDMYTIGRTLPATFGAGAPRGNYADLRTTGWEAMLTFRDGFDLRSSPLDFDVRLTLADHSSEILRYNNPDRFLNDYYPGQKVGEVWGFVTDGFFQSAEEIAAHADQSLYRSHSSGRIQVGDIRLKDVNGDGRINNGANTADNPGDRVVIGNITPRYRFGVNLGASWNNVFFSTFFQGVGKQDWYPHPETNTFWGQYNRPYGEIPTWHLRPGMIWSAENPNSFFPRYTSRLANNSAGVLRQPQSKYMMNAAYVRLKSLQVGYNLPSRLTERLGSSAARIYFTGENLWTYSPLYDITNNIDVENATTPSERLFQGNPDGINAAGNFAGNSGDGYNYPMLKSYNLGLSVTF